MAVLVGLLGLLGLGFELIGTPIFLLFMLEETVQATGFGVFTLMQGKMWLEAKAQNARYRKSAALMLDWSDTIGDFLGSKEKSDAYVAQLQKDYDNAVRLGYGSVVLDIRRKRLDDAKASGAGLWQSVIVPFKEFAQASLATADGTDKRIAKEQLLERVG